MIKSVLFRRVLAFKLDVPVYAFPTMILVMFTGIFEASESALIVYIDFILLMFFAPLTIVLRDLISKGRSFGKRVFELYIIDENTGERASRKQLIIRNLFLIIYFIDGCVLIVTGRSIGDRVTNTSVVKYELYIQQN